MSRLDAFRVAQAVLLALGVFAATLAALALTRDANTVAAVWPIDALVVTILIRWARSPSEEVLALGLSAALMVVANLLQGSSLLLAVALVTLNVGEILLTRWLVLRFGRPIDSLKAFAAFILGAVLVGPLLAGLAAAAVFSVAAPASEPLGVALRWLLADGLGMAIVGTLALSVGPLRARPDELGPVWLRFLGGQVVVLAGACLILLQPDRPPLFLLAPFLVLGALSHRELGGLTAVATTSFVAWAATITGRGPAAVAILASADPILLMQLLLATMVFTVFPISALLRRLDLLAAELEERRARAEELNAVKTRLLAYVSHEIRSPLSGVTSLAELMRDGALGELTPEQRDTLGQILSSGAEVDQLARDLTDAAVLQSGKASIRIGQVGVGEAIRAAVNVALFRTSQYEAEIQAAPGTADALSVAADPLRLRQILVNFLVNGAKYGGRPPLIVISARLTEAGAVRFEVSDNGVGIPPEQRVSLFRDFERLGAEKADLDGAGLGLALSNEIARLQHGSLGLEDSELGGVKFWLDLPLWDDGGIAVAAWASTSAPRSAGEMI
jgi:signal transduction histidine kinase